ncbi:MAG: hypothetical protein EBZ75_13490 [Oxalobacteraceae bacterium]|nr:hypothetical protein [Oxalobacteraceae bacterium]
MRRATMGAWPNGSATSARLTRESMIRNAYGTGYYQPLLPPMASYPKDAQAASSAIAIGFTPEQMRDFADVELSVRDAQYNQLKDAYMRSLVGMGLLATVTLYLLVTRGR